MDKKIANYCTKCGAKLTNGVCFQCAGNNNFSAKADEYASLYSSPDEKTVAILGKKYLDRYMMNGVVKYGFAVLSNKRLYLNGKGYNVTERKNGSKNFRRTSQNKSFDLRDIIGVGYEDTPRHKWFILNIIILLLSIPVSFFLAYMFVVKLLLPNGVDITEVDGDGFGRLVTGVFIVFLIFGALFWFYSIYMSIMEAKTYITIQYTGGIVAFEQKWYSEINMEKFRDSVHIAKDKIVSENAKVVAAKMEAVPTQKASVADEISKLNELLAQRILSQEEFEKAKKELLGL